MGDEIGDARFEPRQASNRQQPVRERVQRDVRREAVSRACKRRRRRKQGPDESVDAAPRDADRKDVGEHFAERDRRRALTGNAIVLVFARLGFQQPQPDRDVACNGKSSEPASSCDRSGSDSSNDGRQRLSFCSAVTDVS